MIHMRSESTLPAWLPLLAAGALLWPLAGAAQTTPSLYQLSPVVPAALADSDPGSRAGIFSLGQLRIGSSWQGAAGAAQGAGLSLEAGQSWYARFGMGRGVARVAGIGLHGETVDLLSVGGGYRWSDGQSLSLQLLRGNRQQRLGLAVSYDWPSYFLRMDYDTGVNLINQDSLRFSAGVRF